MSRFAVDPQWLVYLPPTMSPTRDDAAAGGCWSTPTRRSPTSAARACRTVVCEEKHMGSRAVVVVCRDGDAARERFGVATARRGGSSTRAPAGASSTTRDGERGVARRACAPPSTRAGLWDEFATDWVCLDCELMPWSAKAQELLSAVRRRRRRRHAPAWRRPSRRAEQAAARGLDRADELLELAQRDAASTSTRYVDAYRPLLLAGRVARRPEARAVPPAGHARAASTSTATTSGTCDARDGSSRPTPSWFCAHRRDRVVDVTDPASRGGRRSRGGRS